jgi:hypothetical protein
LRTIEADIKVLARQAAPEAITTLKKIMVDEKAPHAARIAAGNALLDRGYGRPAQAVDLTVKPWNLDLLSDAQLLELEQIVIVLEAPGSTQEALPAPSPRDDEMGD